MLTTPIFLTWRLTPSPSPTVPQTRWSSSCFLNRPKFHLKTYVLAVTFARNALTPKLFVTVSFLSFIFQPRSHFGGDALLSCLIESICPDLASHITFLMFHMVFITIWCFLIHSFTAHFLICLLSALLPLEHKLQQSLGNTSVSLTSLYGILSVWQTVSTQQTNVEWIYERIFRLLKGRSSLYPAHCHF